MAAMWLGRFVSDYCQHIERLNTIVWPPELLSVGVPTSFNLALQKP